MWVLLYHPHNPQTHLPLGQEDTVGEEAAASTRQKERESKQWCRQYLVPGFEAVSEDGTRLQEW